MNRILEDNYKEYYNYIDLKKIHYFFYSFFL